MFPEGGRILLTWPTLVSATRRGLGSVNRDRHPSGTDDRAPMEGWSVSRLTLPNPLSHVLTLKGFIEPKALRWPTDNQPHKQIQSIPNLAPHPPTSAEDS